MHDDELNKEEEEEVGDFALPVDDEEDAEELEGAVPEEFEGDESLEKLGEEEEEEFAEDTYDDVDDF